MTREQIKLLNLYSQYKYGVNFSEIVNFQIAGMTNAGLAVTGIGAGVGGLSGLALAAIKKNKSYDTYKAEAEAKGEKPLSRVAYIAKSKEFLKGGLIGAGAGAGVGAAIAMTKARQAKKDHMKDIEDMKYKQILEEQEQFKEKIRQDRAKRQAERNAYWAKEKEESKKWEENFKKDILKKLDNVEKLEKELNEEYQKAKDYPEVATRHRESIEKYVDSLNKSGLLDKPIELYPKNPIHNAFGSNSNIWGGINYLNSFSAPPLHTLF